ncbi:MAG: MerR family transcriptional regulator [Bradyrhizobium sp.]|nr:MerR family transcriptional regulator [Bradyrhizobium sp.]MDE2331049.1 MerR family transcriptional regulator [Bradyrhizobium sp.]
MTRQEFLTSSGVEAQTLEFWLEQEWLIPERNAGGMRFSEHDVARARLIRDLKADLGINDEGIDVVLHLVDQLHGVRRALAQLRAELRREPT